MKSNHDARIGRLEGRLNPEAGRDPMAKPIAPEDLAFLDEYERVTEDTTVAEHQNPARGRELLRIAAGNALGPFGFSDRDIAAYVNELEAGLRELQGGGASYGAL